MLGERIETVIDDVIQAPQFSCEKVGTSGGWRYLAVVGVHEPGSSDGGASRSPVAASSASPPAEPSSVNGA